jgi:tetratricopeptide (TPR) repeat protein
MRPRTWLALAVAVTALGALGFELRKRQDTAQAVAEASRLLEAPLTRAPDLSQIPSARARSVIDRALDQRQDAQLLGLKAWASALDMLQKGRAEGAREPLGEARRALGGRPALELLAAHIALRLGEIDAAEAALRSALALAPREPRARLLAIDIALERSRAVDALDALDTLDAELSSGPAALRAGLSNRRGVALEQLGRGDDALAAYEAAVALDASFAQGHVNLGRLVRARGELARAEAAFGSALLASPGFAEAWLGRGLCRIAQGDVAGGALDLEQSRTLAPQASAPLIALADLDVHRGDAQSRVRGIDRYRAALLIEPSHAVAWLKLGNALMRGGAHAEAKAAFERAIEHDGSLAAAHNGLGTARMALGDDDGALAALTLAHDLAPSDPNPTRNLALLHARN